MTIDVENELVIAFYTCRSFLLEISLARYSRKAWYTVYRRGKISRGQVFGAVVEIVKERVCSRVGGGLRRIDYQFVSWLATKGIVHDESPGDERHRPTDKGEDSTLME